MATTIAELLVEIGVEVKDAKKAEKAVADVKDETEKLDDTAKKTKKSLGGMAKAAGKTLAKAAAVGAAAIAALGVAVFALVNDQTAAADATNKLAAALGAPAEELQRLSFAAGQSGLEAEKLKGALLKLNTANLSLAEGTQSGATQALAELGLGVKDLDGLSQSNQIGLIGEALQGIEGDADRSAFAARIFGEEAGPAMASLLAEGREGIDALGASADVLSQEQLDKASAFQDSMGELSNLFEGFVQLIAVELVPPILEVVQGIQQWVEANRPLIDSGLDIFLGLLSDVFGRVVKETKIAIAIFKAILSPIIAVAQRIEDATGGFTAYKEVLLALFTPLQTVGKLIVKLLKGLEKVGVVSEGTADRFEQSMNRIAEAGDKFDDVAVKADDAAQAIRDFNFESDSAASGFDATAVRTPAQKASDARAQAATVRANNRANRGGPKGSAGGKGDTSKDKPKEPEIPGLTLGQFRAEVAAGNVDVLGERIKGLQPLTPSTADVKPTVAINFFAFSKGSIPISIEAGANPLAQANGIARHVAQAIKDETSKVAADIPTATKR